ncbi:unnamed protein product [Gongylonema pulchrum]|uniref:Thioredoxin domain-containing protein n=1 Tax=Gongylonema pulchrum TaxID=637853 RepID=A0A183D9Q8_9BILA|nr:unnamed protein product [Gongylonema pulchrum]
MVVRELPDDSAFGQFLADAGTRLMVVDFYAEWCGPCRMIAPHVHNLSEKYQQVVFIKVNVEICRQTSAQFQIRAMPTFVLLSNGQELDRLLGANVEMLEAKIVQQLNQFTVITPHENAFLQQFVSYAEKMALYEDDVAQTLARSLLPYDKLPVANDVNEKTNEFELAKWLLNWFKTEFFKWVDALKCESCKQDMDKCEGCSFEVSFRQMPLTAQNNARNRTARILIWHFIQKAN